MKKFRIILNTYRSTDTGETVFKQYQAQVEYWGGFWVSLPDNPKRLGKSSSENLEEVEQFVESCRTGTRRQTVVVGPPDTTIIKVYDAP